MAERNGASDPLVAGNSIVTAATTELTRYPSAKFLTQEETERLLHFLASNIRNPDTRGAYVRAVRDFFRWSEARGITLTATRPVHIAAYMEGASGAEPSLKQKLAAIRMLFDWLVTGGILPTNPTADTRAPRPIVKVGKTSVLTAQEAQILMDSMRFDHSPVTRDRALISLIYNQRRLNIWKNFWGE